MSARPGATDRVRQELARVELVEEELAAEAGALLRAAGMLARRSDGWRLELLTTTGATARRAHQLLGRLGAAPSVSVREATNVSARAYGVALDASAAAPVGRLLGLLDPDGRPTSVAPPEHAALPAALLRGAMLGGGSVSAPHRPPHLELRAAHEATAEQLAATVQRLVGVTPSVGATDTGHRAVLKSGAAVVALLEALGAPVAAADHADQRERRRLRADAQRLVNADAANVRRAVEAAGDQVQLVERAIEELGWEGLSEELREVALARLANPSASLADLGRLCDPPVGKSAVHRRLARLRTALEEQA